MSKQELFLKEIIFKHVPIFVTNPLLQEHYLSLANIYPKSVNVEHLTEIALSVKGGYNFIDSEYQDFDDIDSSDSKTTSIIFSSKQIFLGSIAKKLGALRITIYNPHMNRIDYMFMPYGEWQRMAKKCHGENTEGKLRLIMTWSQDRDTYNKFEVYRLNTFDELATATSENFYKKYPHLLDYNDSVFGEFFEDNTPVIENLLTSS